jgi:hypothetical protein
MTNLPDFPSFSIPIPELPEMNFDTPLQHMWADEQFEILKRYIQEFESALDAEHEVGIMMTNFGQSILMNVQQITYEDPVLMVFKGYVNGRAATLIQHTATSCRSSSISCVTMQLQNNQFWQQMITTRARLEVPGIEDSYPKSVYE